MSNRSLGSTIILAAVVALLSLAPVPVAGQAPAAAKTWTPPRTLDGQPDIQGVWNNGMGGQYDVEGILGEVNDLLNVPADPFIIPRVRTQPDQSLVVDPADGKIPYQPWAAAKAKEHHDHHTRPTKPEYIDGRTHCYPAGVPRQIYSGPGGQQILQSPGYVVILNEWSHIYRIIPLDGRPHVGGSIQLWMGDSRGHWEGNTLVVNTTNLNDRTWFDIVGDFHSDALHVVERFTVLDADTINYEATLEDPKVYTRPWKMALTIRRIREKGYELMESACHEGESFGRKLLAGRAEAK